ncbi:amidohydrolase family protein [Elioraea rosea]|uniref:amidohydrolase family protein n=1 Tax=Elioraea rosea TaxID=2492390 RepID=UPI001EF752D9|nr:amidohydrolase family protein [Elioraea rosea]
MLIRNVRPLGEAACDILIEGGRIAAIGPSSAAPAGADVEKGRGLLALPGLVEGHSHLDKTLWGLGWYRNDVGPNLTDKIDNERRYRAETNHDAGAASLAMARRLLANGTTSVRTFVDVDTDAGLKHLHGVIATRGTMAPIQRMQVVAFPQSGILRMPGTDRLLDEAMTAGADVVGGLDPCGIDRDPVRHLDVVFGLAQKHGKPVDIHLHEPGEMGAFSLDLILERTAALGMRGSVVISHGFCLAMIEPAQRDALLARMAQWEVSIATTAAPSRPVPTVPMCRAAGVTLFAGNDGMRDTWGPYGTPDMLERAMIVGLRSNLRRDEELLWALETVSAAGARGCGFDGHVLEPGARADVVLVEAETVAEAVVSRSPRQLVVSGGRVIARGGSLVGGA